MRHIHPLEPIAVVVLVIVFFYFRRKQNVVPPPPKVTAAEPRAAITRERAPRAEEPPEVVFQRMREQALGTSAASLTLAMAPRDNDPYGVLMEMGISNSVVTLACFGDGDASLFYKSGGGMVGGIGHESVRKAAKELTLLAQKCLPMMITTTAHPEPGPDRVRFYVLTPKATYTTETDRESLSETESDLATLFASGQEVVTRMRQVQEQKRSAGTPAV